MKLIKVLHFVVENGCSDIRGTLVNGKIRFTKSPINGQFPVGTRTFFSCNPGYRKDAIGGGRCKKADFYNPNPYWFTFKPPKCKGNEINRLTKFVLINFCRIYRICTNIFVKNGMQSYYLFKRQKFYHCNKETQRTERIIKLTPISRFGFMHHDSCAYPQMI